MRTNEFLRKSRENKNLTLEKMSKEIGIPASTISTWERGGALPKGRNLRKLCDFLQLSVEDFERLRRAEDSVDVAAAVPAVGFRKIPVVSWTTAGTAVSYEDLANQIDEFADSTTKDPNAFAVEVVGDSMMTEVHPGDWVILEPNREASSGDMAYVRLKDEAGGGGTLKWFQRTGPEGRVIRLVPENPNWPVTEHPIETVQFAYPVGNIHRRRPRKKL